MDSMDKPQLRPLFFVMTEMQGKRFILAQDQSGMAQPALLPPELEPILRLLDGQHSLRDIQMDLMRSQGGKLVSLDDVTAIVEELDSHLLLDSPRFRETIELEKRFWDQARLRKPVHMGRAYPDEPEELLKMIEGFYCDESGPGKRSEDEEHKAVVRGILSPHIDIGNGGPTFAWAFSRLAPKPHADLYVILGTAHNHTPGPFSISRKDYVTPLGILETDREFISELLGKYSPEWLTDDTAHQAEHSIEFQTIFLKHILGPGDSTKAVPILVGSFDEFLGNCSSPAKNPEVARFLDAFKDVAEISGKKITYIVGGDLAHIGPRYGDRDVVLPMDVQACLQKDTEMLEAAAKGAEEFFDYVAREGDCRNICGMPPLYTMLKLIEGAKGEILHQSHWFDESTRSAVTFAAMVFEQ